MLFIGVALEGTRLAETRTGGMYYGFKIYDYFRRLPRLQVDHDGVSSLPPRLWGLMIKLHLVSLYLLLTRGHRRYDYIFISGAWGCPMYLLFSKLRGAKIVAFWFHRASKQPKLSSTGRLTEWLREWCQLKIADYAVVISRSTLNSLRELGFADDDYVLAVPGLDKEVWSDRTSSYEPNKSGFKVLCTASVIPQKGIMDLVVAFADFLDAVKDREERSGIILDIVGNDRIDHAFVAEIRRVIRDRGLEGNVFLRGRRSLQELIGYYREALVFVHPSHYEGWGIVVLEAASFGLPIIVSSGGSLPEVVNDGEHGIVYPVGDRGALRGQLELVYRDIDRRAALSAKAAELYRRSVTWEQTGRQIEAYLGCEY